MSGAHRRRVVWVVDDSPLDAERARSNLSADYDIQVFVDGSAAIEALSSSKRPDVLVLDWVMPGISGVDVCRFLRSDVKRTQDIGILLLTAQRHTDQIVEGLRAGANDFLPKPYAPEELSARVGALIRSQEFLERAERAESENRRLLENTPDPLLVVDPDGRLYFVNEVAAVALDKSSEHLQGLPLEVVLPELAAALPRTRTDATHPMADVTLLGRRFSPTLRFISDDGRTAIQLRDVTERRVIDERRLDFYSIIAHDLRTPLNSISLRVQMMQKDPLLVAAPTLTQGVQQIDRNLHSLVTMINEFLELASLDSSNHRLDRKEVDLVDLIGRAADDLSPLFEAKQQSWALEGRHAESVKIFGDPRRLHQALTNLIANAIKFGPQRGKVWAKVELRNRHVLISICDNGPGIDPVVAETLFQRYRRAAKSVAGTGLGLMIVREIIEAHGGTVGLDSEQGCGARFWMCLPRGTASD